MAVLIMTSVIAFLIAMTVAYAVEVKAPESPALVKFFIIPLVVFMLLSVILAKMATPVNTESAKVSYYMKNKAYETINQTSYIQVFPPIFVVIVGLIAVIGLGYHK